jgi:hypothetical protein
VGSVRVLGALALIDQGETDWCAPPPPPPPPRAFSTHGTNRKILAIRANHPLAQLLNCTPGGGRGRGLWALRLTLAPVRAALEDIERHLPGAVHGVREWFRTYKIAEGASAPNTKAHELRRVRASRQGGE